MNGIDRISERILEDARAEAARIVKEAQERARSLKERKKEQTEKENEKLYRESMNRAQERKRRMLAVAELEMRKQILATKQQVIDETMERVNQAIKEIPRDEYRRIISQMLLESAQGDEEVFFSVEDEDRLDQSLIDEVNQELISQGKKGGLKLSPERETFGGGFILKSGGMEINNTFEAIIRMSRDEVESQVARILFGEEG
jgi:V/A-type H+-transporting ATPase subunit E